jgi:hypothetical protein
MVIRAVMAATVVTAVKSTSPPVAEIRVIPLPLRAAMAAANMAAARIRARIRGGFVVSVRKVTAAPTSV